MGDPDHQLILFGNSFLVLQFFHFVADEILFVEGFEDMVKAGDHFSREVDKLVVYLSVEFFQVLAFHFEDVSLQIQSQVGKFLMVNSLHDCVSTTQSRHFKMHYEIL